MTDHIARCRIAFDSNKYDTRGAGVQNLAADTLAYSHFSATFDIQALYDSSEMPSCVALVSGKLAESGWGEYNFSGV
jgi:hypothetical protein